MSGSVPLEYLGAATPDRRRAPRVVVAGLLALAATGFLWWSDSVRTSANEQLAAAFDQAVAGAAAGERRVQGTLAYASPMIWSASVPQDGRRDLGALVEAAAAARAELVALIDAQRTRFDRIASDASDIDRVLADGPLPVGAAAAAVRAAAGR